MKNLKIIALSLTLLFCATQAMATGLTCQATVTNQTWFGKIFGSVQSYIKNNQKTSIFAAIALATLVVGVSAWIWSKKQEHTLPSNNPGKENNKNNKTEEKNAQKQEGPQNNKVLPVPVVTKKARNSKKTCIFLYDDNEMYTKKWPELFKAKLKSKNINLDVIKFDGKLDDEKQYELALCISYNSSGRVTDLTNFDSFETIKNKANKSAVISVCCGSELCGPSVAEGSEINNGKNGSNKKEFKTTVFNFTLQDCQWQETANKPGLDKLIEYIKE